jgi:hypothetical protein
MAATQPLKDRLCQPFLDDARAELDLPEVWPELDIVSQGSSNPSKIVMHLFQPFHQDDC